MFKYSHKFFKHVKHECRRYNVKFILINKNEIKLDNLTCDAYFSVNPLELVLATRLLNSEFFSNLVHEFSHLEQWRDDSPYYINYNGMDTWTIINKWVQGYNYTKKTIKGAFNIYIDGEIDCERRAIENIKKFNIPLNIKHYCKNYYR